MRLATNASQQVTSSSQPDAFGLGSVTSGTASAYQWNGSSGYREEGIGPAGLSSYYGFQKVGARYYDPAFGCFLTRDTDLSQKPYAYCEGDSVNFNDPSGHLTVFDVMLAPTTAAPDTSPINLAQEVNIKGKGTASGTYDQKGPIRTFTATVTLQIGRTNITDTLTYVQAPTLTKVTDTFGFSYTPFGSISFGLAATGATRGSPTDITLIVRGNFNVDLP